MSRQANDANIYGIVTDKMTKVGNFTLKGSMNGFWIRCQANGADIDVDLPKGLAEGFTCVLFNDSAFAINLNVPAGVTLRSVGGFTKVSAQYGEMGIFSFAPNTFKLSGNLA